MKHTSVLFLAIMLLILAGCAEKPDVEDNDYKPIVLTAEESSWIESENSFAIFLLSQLNIKEKGSFVVSPLNLQVVLAMLLGGTIYESVEQEFRAMFGYGTIQKVEVEYFCSRLIKELPFLDKLSQVTMAPGILADSNIPINTEFVKTIDLRYGASCERPDFSKTKAVRQMANNWASKNTNGMVSEIISKDEVDLLPELATIPLGVAGFKGYWAKGFDRRRTESGTFTCEDGTDCRVKYMKRQARISVAYIDNRHPVVQIPYGNGAYSMIVALPQEGGITTLLKSMESVNVAALPFSADQVIDLWLPKFELESSLNPIESLKTMGMECFFSRHYFGQIFRADDDNRLIKIGYLKQGTAIIVNESGVEVADNPEPVSPIAIHADHPFLFFIAEKSTGAILFEGCYRGE